MHAPISLIAPTPSAPRARIRARSSRRRGTSLVEFAIVAPVLFMVFLAAVEFARMNQIANTSAFAAYEGCRTAIVPGATAAQATSAAQAILAASLISTSNSTVTINPSTITSSTTTVMVTVAVPMNANSWTRTVFSKNMTVTRSCVLTREVTN